MLSKPKLHHEVVVANPVACAACAGAGVVEVTHAQQVPKLVAQRANAQEVRRGQPAVKGAGGLVLVDHAPACPGLGTPHQWPWMLQQRSL